MAQVTVTLNCSAPVEANFFQMAQIVEYFQKQMKVKGLKNNLNGKITIEAQDKNLVINSSVKYSKRAIRYYARKFAQKQQLHDRLRVVATSKTSYEFRPYRADKEE